jgi:hypothetical protein
MIRICKMGTNSSSLCRFVVQRCLAWDPRGSWRKLQTSRLPVCGVIWPNSLGHLIYLSRRRLGCRASHAHCAMYQLHPLAVLYQ